MNEGGPIGPIENYLLRLEPCFEKHGVLLAYLYGSQATGKASLLSDIDIAVLFESGATDIGMTLAHDCAALGEKLGVRLLGAAG